MDDLNLTHLQLELARIDLLLRRQVRRWQLAGQDPDDTFRGLYVSEAEVVALLNRPLGANWGELVTLDESEEQTFAQVAAKISKQTQALLETAHQQHRLLRLERLVADFSLTAFERDVLLLCLGPTLDLRYERLYGFLQDDVTRRRPTINLLLTILLSDSANRLPAQAQFSETAPLFRFRLLNKHAEAGTPLLSQTLSVDETVVAWLLGHYQPHHELGERARLIRPDPTAADTLLTNPGLADLDQLADRPPLVLFSGPDQAGQAATARQLARQSKRALLKVEIGGLVGEGVSPQQTLRLALRDARLSGTILFLTGWDACLDNAELPPDLLQMLCAHPDWVIVAGTTDWQGRGIDRDRRLIRHHFPIPDYSQRLALWQHFLGGSIPAETIDLEALAGQFLLTSGQIRDAVATATDLAAQAARPLHNDDLFAAVRAHSNPRLATLARKIEPRYDWPDIVLPADQQAILREIVASVRGRAIVLEEWGVGRKLASSKGVTVLFAGPPGTGKTMAAEIIAHELRLDLYKIDLSSIISKYIGETEKNLERIFNEASTSNAILFFDEADAIFGKRSEVKDAHDRYANIEVSYLLQRMEAYDGVTILATNLRANLDEAFTRRIQFAVDFPFPEKEDRLQIWEALFPPDVPRAEDIDLALLASRFKLAGGSIRNIIITAAYLAAADGKKVTMDHLFHGTRRELQKMGRLVGEKDLQR